MSFVNDSVGGVNKLHVLKRLHGVQYANELITNFKLTEFAHRTLVHREQHQFLSIPPSGISKHFRH